MGCALVRVQPQQPDKPETGRRRHVTSGESRRRTAPAVGGGSVRRDKPANGGRAPAANGGVTADGCSKNSAAAAEEAAQPLPCSSASDADDAHLATCSSQSYNRQSPAAQVRNENGRPSE